MAFHHAAPRPGALRKVNGPDDIIMANPGDPLFSTVSFIADEYYDDGEWKPIFDDGDE